MIFDYFIEEMIECGSFSETLLVKKIGGVNNGNPYVAKYFSKRALRQDHIQLEVIENEKRIFEEVKDGPFFNKIIEFVENHEEALIVLHYLPFPNLTRLLRERLFSENHAKLYASEIIIALEYLHKNNIIHRNIKLNNIGLDGDGHVVITDFGLSTKIEGRKYSLRGTQYLAPEIRVHNETYNSKCAADWWCLGVCLYKMLVGSYPYGPENDTYNAVLIFPEYISMKFVDFLRKLLKINPRERLGGGSGGIEEIKSHPLFSDTDWRKVAAREVELPVVREWKNRLNNFGEITTGEGVRRFELSSYWYRYMNIIQNETAGGSPISEIRLQRRCLIQMERQERIEKKRLEEIEEEHERIKQRRLRELKLIKKRRLERIEKQRRIKKRRLREMDGANEGYRNLSHGHNETGPSAASETGH